MTTTFRRPADLRRLNQVLDAALAGWPFSAETERHGDAGWYPATDVVEDAEGVRIVVELPGVNPETVNVSLENQVLSISGDKPATPASDEARTHRFERSVGHFERSFRLGDTVDPSRVNARHEHGVLTLTLPRAEQAKPRKIEIAVK